MSAGRRLAAYAAGVVLGVAALWGTSLVVLAGGYASERPDSLGSGPDSWAEVGAATIGTAAIALVDGLLLVAAAGLIWWASRSSWPNRRTLVGLPVLMAVACVVAIGLAQALSL